MASGTAFSQALVTIRQVQEPHPDSLLAGNDTSPFFGDTVRIRGVVATPPGAGVSSSTNGRWIWVQDGAGPWGGINVRKGNGNATTPQDMLFAAPGDSVEIVGVVNNFANETQIDPLDAGGFTVLGASTVRWNTTSSLVDFINPNADPNTVAGEPWEGQLFELINVTVVSVTATSQDIRFRIQDASGNEMEVYDTYTVQQPTTVSCSNCIPYPPFSPPAVGDIFDTLRGVIDGRNFGTSPPYSIAPFDTTHYIYGASAAKINNVFRDIQVPTSSQAVTVSATITDNGGMVTAARLFYALGETNNNYTQVNMTNTSGSNYTGQIPAGSNNQMVKFYIEADDNDANTTVSPGGAPSTKTHFYWVKDNGTLSIRDIQYTPYSDGESGYLGDVVSVGGVVTASASPSAGGLGVLYIQDRSFTEWSGIWIAPGSNIDPVTEYGSMLRGDTVVITGTVEENFGVTRILLENGSDYNVLGSIGPASPQAADPDDFTTYNSNFERFESMLLEFVPNAPADSIFIVSANADDPSDFGEYRVGHDIFDPNTGSRVLVGRAQGSNNFSLTTARNDLVVNVNRIIVTQGEGMEALAGIMYFSFGNWKLLPRDNGDITGYPLSLSADNFSYRYRIFPNPTDGLLNLDFEIEPSEAISYQVYDILGRTSKAGRLNSAFNRIDLNGMEAGQYLIRLTEANGNSASHRIIIK